MSPWRVKLWPLVRRLIVDRRGVAIIESAFTISIFLMLVFGVIEIGRLLWIANAIHVATQQAARCAAVNQTLCGPNESNMQDFAQTVSGAQLPNTVYRWYKCESGAVGQGPNNNPVYDGLMVKATYAVDLYIPLYQMSPRVVTSDCFPKICSNCPPTGLPTPP